MATVEFDDPAVSSLHGYSFEHVPKVGEILTSWEGRGTVISEVTSIAHHQGEGYFSLVVQCKVLERTAGQTLVS